MKHRHKFRGTEWESLEDRRLLSALSTALGSIKHHAAHVFGIGHRHPHITPTASRGFVLGGAVSPGSTTPAANGAASGGISKLNIRIPERNWPGTSAPPAVATGSIGPAVGTASSSVSPQNPFLAAMAANPMLANGPYAVRTEGGAVVVGASGGPFNVGGLPISPVVPTASTPAATDQTSTTIGAASSSPVVLVPGGTGSTASATTSASPSSTSGAPAPMPVGGSMIPGPMSLGLLGGATLSTADVASLKQTVDTFAASYTSGADATKDQAAVTALQAGLTDLGQSVWSETHVASKDAVTQFQQAADSFAQNYTSGASLAQDKAAWTALQTALGTFASSLTNPGAASGTSSTPTPGMPPAFALMPMMGPGFKDAAGSILAGETFSANDVSTIKNAVDTFAASYTSGADAAKDQAAVGALESSLADLAASHWNNVTPPMAPATTTTAAVGSATTAPPTSPSSGPSLFTSVQSPSPIAAVAAQSNGLPTGKA